VMRFTPTIVYTFYQDHEGSITHVYGGLTLAETYRYDAFGQPKILSPTGSQLTTSAINNRFMFTGREWAPVNLGFYEYRARAYHPGLGRFMSEDPKGFDAGDYNLFRYCGNDPEDRADPMGLQTIGDAAERAAEVQRSYMQSLGAAARFGMMELADQTSLQGNAAAAMVNAYNNGTGSGAAQPSASQAGGTAGRTGAPSASNYAPGEAYKATRTYENYDPEHFPDGKIRSRSEVFIKIFDRDGKPVSGVEVTELKPLKIENQRNLASTQAEEGFTRRTQSNGQLEGGPDHWYHTFSKADGFVIKTQSLQAGGRTLSWTTKQTIYGLDELGTARVGYFDH